MNERFNETLRKVGKIGTIGLFGLSTLIPQPVSADNSNRIVLTPPEGSVTPQASGQVNAEVLSVNSSTYKVDLRLTGSLNGLIADRVYRVWACWDTPADCGTNSNPEIKTNAQGYASFEVEFDIFNRPTHPISSIRVSQITEGRVPKDACFLVSEPCLTAPFHPSVVR